MLTKLLIEEINSTDLKLISDLTNLEEIYVTDKILVEDKYGVLNTSVRNIMTNKFFNIFLAVDKTAYWVNMAKEIHGDKYDYSLVKYIDNETYVKIICPIHGVFPQRPNSHLSGKKGCQQCGRKRCGAQNAENAEQKYITQCEKYSCKFIRKIVENHSAIIFYTGLYGLEYKTYFKTNKKIECNLTTVLDKTAFFIAESVKLTGKKYNHQYVIYNGNKDPILLECNDCGYIFERRPNDHLTKTPDCMRCSLLQRHFNGFSRKGFIDLCNKNNNGIGILYVIRCWDENEEFYKIGITSRSVGIRFQWSHHLPYKYEIVQEILCNPDVAWDLEKILHKLYINYDYRPLKNFGGKTECFKI